ncbi:MAG: glycerate kinase [Pseudomonadota bacterium]|nr:glycerate kinase [Pseudomonadota bacterium]
MNILVLPDSFKESLSATRFCEIAESVIRRRLPGARVLALPMADGGEGTAEALVTGTRGEFVRATVTGPMGDPVTARWGLLGDGVTAVVEMAEASGLPLVPTQHRDPLRATSRGTGELILDALDRGVRRIVLALGGSATNDAGAGALGALGFRFSDAQGADAGRNASSLAQLSTVSRERRDPRLDETDLVIASDVTNPLLGERGATYTYGRQKGAEDGQLLALEKALSNFAGVTSDTIGRDESETPGAGAAGGMGYGFLSYCNASIRSGFDVVAEAYGLKDRLARDRFDLIITGEGAINFQSVQGKLIGRITELGRSHGIPVVALAGAIRGDVSELYGLGLTSMTSILDRPMSLEDALRQTEPLLEKKLTDLCSLFGRCFAGESRHI